MPVDFHQIPHEGIRNLTPYKPGKPIVEVMREFGITDIIKLASNENALGCSPAVKRVLADIEDTIIAQYPSAINHPLYEKLAAILDIPTNNLLISNGSDLIFLLLFMGFALHTGKHVLTHDYAFSTYQIQAQGLGIPVISAKVRDDLSVDIDALINLCTEKTGLICLANPNNPTGHFIEQKEIRKLLENIPKTTLLVLDEAYFEYAKALYTPNSITWLDEYPNLVITRTFSKAYGLAGLRLGYATAHKDIISLLHRLQLPFVVNQVALAAGVAALEDTQFLENTLQTNIAGRKQMLDGLLKLGVSHLPATANFVTIDCGKDGLGTYEKLLQKGIIVRPLHAYNLPRHLRVTIGTAEQNARFLNALNIILDEESL